ncbi:MAG: glycoside hydrolase family 3 C-terminal domain-containing protein [Bacilli bacterium]|nr:glycoside hydrolase family 3 C-terminal domain-containing protein [Bacilli bacterium]
MGIKKFVRKRTIIWGATSIFLIGLFTTANVLMRGELRELIYSSALGGPRPIVAQTDDSIDFGQKYLKKKDAYENGNRVTAEICEEGMILLKNKDNALPLKKNAKVSVFGKNSVNLVYGGSGSAAPDKNGSRTTILDSLKDAGFEVNTKLSDFYSSSKSGKGRSENLDMKDGVSSFAILETGETPISSYPSDVIDSYGQYGDAALVVFSRIAGEGFDLPRHASDDSSRHYLELDNNERALLKHIVDSGKFSHIVVLLNGSNYIDLGFLKNGLDGVSADKLDACINIGSPGANGIAALGKILSGEVNPSGHTVDLVYTKYQDDPTWENFGGNFDDSMDFYYAPNGTDKTEWHMVEYEENIYMGYRYYETRGKDNESWYQDHVVYPFGFGLSYTTFSAEIANKAELEAAALNAKEPFKAEVKVTNTGNVDGKQVIQVYAEAPYTNGGIEKPYKVLAGFGKTKLLGKGKSDTIEIEINPYYFASFDNHDKNSDGFKGFTLDSGDYKFHVATDSHTDIDVFTKNLASTVNFDKDPTTGTEVIPLFDDVTAGMKSNLSRTDWEGTKTTRATVADRTIDMALRKKLMSTDSHNDDTSFNEKELPKMNEIGDKAIRLKDLAAAEYNDERWDAFLDQLSFQDMLDLFNKGCYSTCAIEKTINGEKVVLVPKTTSCDGPTGIVAFLGDPAVYGTCYYCSECLVAQTYNLELAAKQAEAIGEEALIGDEKTTLGYPGWYAPGVNLHRSPFSGRNTEYYSEDPFLCGRFAATVIDGVQKKGVYANVKHFAVNDQETNRSAKGIATWVDEQAMREMYLRPFEMAVKEGKSRGLMTSFNRIGTTWAGGDYRLVTKVLREEWGFVGSVICDFHTSANDYMDSKQMLYAGGDLNLTGQEQVYLTEGSGDTNVSSTNKQDVLLLRNASHNLLYCVANSNAMKADVIGYKNAVWENALTAGTITVGVGIVGWGLWAFISIAVAAGGSAAVTNAATEDGDKKD